MAKERLTTCEECGTANTPLWRKDDRNRNLCNACGIRWKRSLTSKTKKSVLIGIMKPHAEHKHKVSSKISALGARSAATRYNANTLDLFELLIAAAESEYEHLPHPEADLPATTAQPELLAPASPAPAPPSAYASSAEEEGVCSDMEPQHQLSAPLPALPSVLLQRAHPSFMAA